MVRDPRREHESRLDVDRRGPDASGAITLRLSGELDLHTADRLSGHLADVAAHRPSSVILDCEAVEFLDSAGLRAVLQGRMDLADTPLVIDRPSAVVDRLLEVTGLRETLTSR